MATVQRFQLRELLEQATDQQLDVRVVADLRQKIQKKTPDIYNLLLILRTDIVETLKGLEAKKTKPKTRSLFPEEEAELAELAEKERLYQERFERQEIPRWKLIIEVDYVDLRRREIMLKVNPPQSTLNKEKTEMCLLGRDVIDSLIVQVGSFERAPSLSNRNFIANILVPFIEDKAHMEDFIEMAGKFRWKMSPPELRQVLGPAIGMLQNIYMYADNLAQRLQEMISGSKPVHEAVVKTVTHVVQKSPFGDDGPIPLVHFANEAVLILTSLADDFRKISKKDGTMVAVIDLLETHGFAPLFTDVRGEATRRTFDRDNRALGVLGGLSHEFVDRIEKTLRSVGLGYAYKHMLPDLRVVATHVEETREKKVDLTTAHIEPEAVKRVDLQYHPERVLFAGKLRRGLES